MVKEIHQNHLKKIIQYKDKDYKDKIHKNISNLHIFLHIVDEQNKKIKIIYKKRYLLKYLKYLMFNV